RSRRPATRLRSPSYAGPRQAWRRRSAADRGRRGRRSLTSWMHPTSCACRPSGPACGLHAGPRTAGARRGCREVERVGSDIDGEGGPATEALRIGRYRVDAVLGTGAFATVYRAVDERLDDIVAVKVLAENHSLDPELRERFLTEGRVLRRVASRHVVAVHDLGETDRQQPYLVLEYADRDTLARRVPDLLARGWRPGVRDLWAVAAPLA